MNITIEIDHHLILLPFSVNLQDSLQKIQRYHHLIIAVQVHPIVWFNAWTMLTTNPPDIFGLIQT